ncbi:DivIVA domain-containing protein [Peijinzhouia sedimentorum]
MKITPLEIRQKTFEKAFRGYDKDEVTSYLNSLSMAWDRMIEDNNELKAKLDAALKDVEKMKQVESTLFKTLRTAEETGATVVQQANKAAELSIKEAEMKSQQLISDAQKRAREIQEQAEDNAKDIISAMEAEVKLLEEAFKDIQGTRNDFITDMRNTVNDLLKKVDKLELRADDYDVGGILKQARSVSRKVKGLESWDNVHERSEELPMAEVEDIDVEDNQKFARKEEIEADFDEHYGSEEIVEEKEEESPEEEEKIETRFVSPPANPNNQKIVHQLGEEDDAEIENTDNSISKPKKGGSFFDEI